MEGDCGLVECELMTRLRMEDGRADGNLIVEEGIFLGNEPAVETAGGMTGDVDYRNPHMDVEVEL